MDIVIILFILSVALIYRKYISLPVTYVMSNVDNEYYLVQDVTDKNVAADMLALIKKNVNILIEHLVKNKYKYKEYEEYINQLVDKFKSAVISETDGTGKYTSYSVNKGEKIVFCLRSRKDNKMHNINLVMYVALHEVSHVACPDYGHTALFRKVFAFLTKVAIEVGIYKKIDFMTEPIEYCGLVITDSII